MLHNNRDWRAGRLPCGWGGSNERLDHQCHHARAEGAAPRNRIVPERRRPVGDSGRDRQPGRESRAASRRQSPVFRGQRARQERLRAQSRRRVRQSRHSARRAAERDRQRDCRRGVGHEPGPGGGPGQAVSRESRRRQLVHRRLSRPLRDASRLPSRPSGLPPPHHERRRKDRESAGAHGARWDVVMNARVVGRPEPDEIPSHYVGYIKRVPELDPVIACAAQIEDTATLLRGLSDTDAMYRYERGKWSIKEVVGHLGDVERIMAYRALRIPRGDTTPLPGFDENAYVPVAKFDARALGDLVGELRTARAATLALLRTFDAEAWRRRGTASGKPVSVRALAYMIPGHERHHVEILRTRYGVGAGSH